jgi:hypothetical protein
MSWIHRYCLRHYFRNAVWILPLFGTLAAMVSVNAIRWIEQRVGWQSGIDRSSALSLFGALAGSLLSFIVFSLVYLVARGAGCQRTAYAADHRRCVVADEVDSKITPLLDQQ